MGIPSYFSYIVKNYINVIKKFKEYELKIDNLFLDCNSIIYDSYRNIDISNNNAKNISKVIIASVIAKIEEYVRTINPSKLVYIAFDGVAPVAKLEQQRQRRYKSWYQNEVSRQLLNKDTKECWNTASITPGTTFMYELNETVTKHFDKNMCKKLGVKNIIVSGSNNVGEGEHKIFEYIRQNNISTKTVIYGLDADLIMLSINHLPICPNIYLFRETPHFIQTIDNSLEPNENYCIDILELTKSIMNYLKTDNTNTNINININIVYDYIFLCFFLGNDFLPHFPAVNIRTGGTDKLLNVYKNSISSKGLFLTDGKVIFWNNVRKLVEELANLEEEYIIEEHKLRNKKERIMMPNETPEDKYKRFDATPIYERELEKYINPIKPNWQYRYYRTLFGIKNDTNGEQRKDIAINYLEGLEWTLKYYTTGCPNWRWRYKYMYPPLLQDLIRYMPIYNTEFMPFATDKKPVSELVQLCYVLPRTSLNLLPNKLYFELIRKYDHWYRGNYEFVWAYCKYFWEAHVDMNEIDINELERFIKDRMEK